MSELYTSLIRAKEELNGGALPDMTPVPERLWDKIDPDFTIGMGALDEDPDLGLRCPVRGCGCWFHSLTKHANATHQDIGGADGIKRLLDIPPNAPLSSRKLREHSKAQWKKNMDAGRIVSIENQPKRRTGISKKMIKAASRTRRSTGIKNMTNRCNAQIKQRMAAIYTYLGRSPTLNEAVAIDQGAVSAAQRIYGSWNNAKAALGWDVFPRHAWRRGKPDWTREMVVSAMQAWYEKHNSLPRHIDAQKATRTPLIPSPATIKRAVGEKTWPEAMRAIAEKLGIRDGRYGTDTALKHVRNKEAA